MKKTKQEGGKKPNELLTLAPLDFEEALADLLKVKPSEGSSRRKDMGKNKEVSSGNSCDEKPEDSGTS